MKTYWISRDRLGGCNNHIKVWDAEPTFIEPNGVWTGKIHMGMLDINDVDNKLEQGTARKVNIVFTEIHENGDDGWKDMGSHWEKEM